MKKRSLIISSIVLLAVSVAAFTSVTFAWFFSLRAPKTEPFAVQVTGTVPLSVGFYRDYEDGNGYTAISPSQSIPYVDGEILIPGENVLCRVDVTNQGDKPADVSVTLKALRFLFTSGGTMTGAEALEIVRENLVVLYGVTYISTEQPNPPEPAEDTLTKQLFLAPVTGVDLPVNAPIIPVFPLAAEQTACVYFRYSLLSTFKGIDGIFGISATGMLFSS